jgi:hypothetical protein
MRTVNSRGKDGQSAIAPSSPDDAPAYETYEQQRVRELDAERLVLRNELFLLERTCENIALWNAGVVGQFPRYIILVGFRFTSPAVPRSLEALQYVWDGLSPKLHLTSYASSHAEVALHQMARGLPNEFLLHEPLLSEILTIHRELRRLDKIQQRLYAYAPGGVAYRKLLRKAAQLGMTRYHLRRQVAPRKRLLEVI